MRRAAIVFAFLLADFLLAALGASGAIAHAETGDFGPSSEALEQTPIIRGLTDAERTLIDRSFDGADDRDALDRSGYAAAWRTGEWVEAVAQEVAALWEPRLTGVLLWLLGLGLMLSHRSRPTKAGVEDR